MSTRRWLDIAKPEYLLRPSQLVRRLLRGHPPQSGEMHTITMPWGVSLHTDVRDVIGQSLWKLGVYELTVSEALWRLIEPGSTVADLGAHMGYMSGLMAARAGPAGTVISYEPNPLMYRRLTANVESWDKARVATVKTRPVAASEASGSTILRLPPGSADNSGLAYIGDSTEGQEGVDWFRVPVTTLDEEFPESAEAPRVIKVDTEGNEAKLFRGATRLLTSGAIRDIIFEDHHAYPTEAMQVLLPAGYKIFRLEKSFGGVRLVDPEQPSRSSQWEPPNYLATKAAERAAACFSDRGWQVLKSRH